MTPLSKPVPGHNLQTQDLLKYIGLSLIFALINIIILFHLKMNLNSFITSFIHFAASKTESQA